MKLLNFILPTAVLAAQFTTYDKGPTFEITYDPVKSLLKYTVLVPQNSYLRLAYGTSMNDVDIVAFLAKDDGIVTDFQADATGQTSLDPIQNYKETTMTKVGTDYNFVTYRPLKTEDDASDFEIKCDQKQSFMWESLSSSADISIKADKTGTWDLDLGLNSDCTAKTVAPETTDPTKTVAETTDPTKTVAETTDPAKTVAETTDPTDKADPAPSTITTSNGIISSSEQSLSEPKQPTVVETKKEGESNPENTNVAKEEEKKEEKEEKEEKRPNGYFGPVLSVSLVFTISLFLSGYYSYQKQHARDKIPASSFELKKLQTKIEKSEDVGIHR